MWLYWLLSKAVASCCCAPCETLQQPLRATMMEHAQRGCCKATTGPPSSCSRHAKMECSSPEIHLAVENGADLLHSTHPAPQFLTIKKPLHKAGASAEYEAVACGTSPGTQHHQQVSCTMCQQEWPDDDCRASNTVLCHASRHSHLQTRLRWVFMWGNCIP